MKHNQNEGKNMSLLEHLKEAARHLKEAARMAVDWRVKGDVANAGTIVNCAIHTQEKAEWGKAGGSGSADERGAGSVER